MIKSVPTKVGAHVDEDPVAGSGRADGYNAP